MIIALTENEKTIVEFLKAIEERNCELEKLYHPETRQTEYPNGLVKNITVRSLEDLKNGLARGQK